MEVKLVEVKKEIVVVKKKKKKQNDPVVPFQCQCNLWGTKFTHPVQTRLDESGVRVNSRLSPTARATRGDGSTFKLDRFR